MTRPIDRRQFALGSMLLGGASALPQWLRRAFAPSPQDPAPAADDREAALRRAIAHARARRKPLLVFVVPADTGQQWSRGGELGAFLNHGGSAALLDLALCVPACATAAEVRAAIPSVGIDDDAWMAVVDPTAERPRAVSIAPDLAALGAPPQYDGKQPWEAWQKACLEHQQKVVAATHAAFRAAVAPDRAALAARADAARETLSDAERTTLDAFVRGDGELPRALAYDAAAVLRMAAAAPRRRGDAERLLGAVAAAARAVFVDARVPGSKWAHSTGCGVEVEGEKDDGGLAIACGMGSVPPLSERFLYFFTG